MYQGKLVRVRDGAKGFPYQGPKPMQSSPPKPLTKKTSSNPVHQQTFGGPNLAPFDKLSPSIQAMRLWFLSQPPRAAASADLWAEELQVMYAARARTPYQFRQSYPLVVSIAEAGIRGPRLAFLSTMERINEEKRQQKAGLPISHITAS